MYQDRDNIAAGAFSQVQACRSVKGGAASSELALKISELPSQRSDNQRTQVRSTLPVELFCWLENKSCLNT